LHLLRNSVDHGIEPADRRSAAGKPIESRLRVAASYQGTQIVLEIEDDGRGINADRIRSAALRGGFATESSLAALSEAEVRELIFLPGFSTAATISEVSGRGVGMDVVRSTVERLDGTVAVESTPGVGTRFIVRLPMTLAVARAVLVKSAGQTFAVPIQAIQQVMRVRPESMASEAEGPALRFKNESYPLRKLSELLQLTTHGGDAGPMPPAILVKAGGFRAAFVVDQLLSDREIVVKTLGSHLKKVRGLIGATLLGDGSVVPILNTVELLLPAELVGGRRRPTAPLDSVRPPTAVVKLPPRDEPLSVLIVDDSVSVRRVLGNLCRNAGWRSTAARDGLDALEILSQMPTPPDIVLLDVEMPRMDGYELLGTLRSQEAYRRLPVVMITSRAGAKHRNQALALGADDYMVKPYQDQDLLATIRRHTRASTAEETPAADAVLEPNAAPAEST
ncbi:MAG: hybrid sensor histidine kinase/response regulator, partial [Planctomycetia bacterium]